MIINITIMENNKRLLYLKTDDNKILNENHIRWVKKINECMEVCTKSTGCSNGDTYKICKLINLDSYNKLNRYFE